jgi:transcriptional regulator with XRE-family HTH domain
MIPSNLRRLMARYDLTVGSLAEIAGVDVRTIKSLLAGRQRPHASTLHKLADGLGITADEFFLPVARENDRSLAADLDFDRATNPAATTALASAPERFVDWTAQEIDELYSRVGIGGELNEAGVLAAVEFMEGRREILEKTAILLETDEADLLRGFVEMLFARATDPARLVQDCPPAPRAKPGPHPIIKDSNGSGTPSK